MDDHEDKGGIFGFGILGSRKEQRGGSRYRMGEGIVYLEATFGFPDKSTILSLPLEEVKNAHELIEQWKNNPVLEVKIVDGKDPFFVVSVRDVHITTHRKGEGPAAWELRLRKA